LTTTDIIIIVLFALSALSPVYIRVIVHRMTFQGDPAGKGLSEAYTYFIIVFVISLVSAIVSIAFWIFSPDPVPIWGRTLVVLTFFIPYILFAAWEFIPYWIGDKLSDRREARQAKAYRSRKLKEAQEKKALGAGPKNNKKSKASPAKKSDVRTSRSKQDDVQATKWFRRKADAGNVNAMTSLGLMYYDGRGVTRDIESSLEFYLRAQEASPLDSTAMRIWLCYSLLGKNNEAEIFLREHRSTHEPDGWASSILSFTVGEITDSKLLELAESDDAKKQDEQLCEAYFNIGSVKMVKGEQTAAISNFQKCIETKVTSFIEYAGAKAELERMKEKKTEGDFPI
jgi:hypothetical protein